MGLYDSGRSDAALHFNSNNLLTKEQLFGAEDEYKEGYLSYLCERCTSYADPIQCEVHLDNLIEMYDFSFARNYIQNVMKNLEQN